MTRWLAVVVAVVLGAAVAQAQPVVVGAGDPAASQGGLVGIDLHNDTAAGDLLLLFCESNEALTTPDGWTLTPDSPSVRSTAPAARLTAYYRTAQTDDIDGDCTACAVADPGNHILCAILTVENVDTSDPFDVSASSNAGSAATTVITGDTATETDTLVVAAVAKADDKSSDPQFSSWVNTASPGGCTALTSLTGQISTSTILGDDGALGVATGNLATAARWCDTQVTGPASGSAHLAFNLREAPPVTNTPTPSQTGTVTTTPTVTNTPTNTGTATNTPVDTSTPTVTQTGTATATHTATGTATSTATVTHTSAACDKQATSGARGRPSSCTGPEDEFATVLRKRTPGGTAFRADSVPRPFNEFYDSNGVRIGTGTSPHKLQTDATLTSSLDDRTIETGISPSWAPNPSAAQLDGWGAVTKTINATITAVFDFIDELPRVGGAPIAPFETIFMRCADIPLDETTYYCRLSGAGPYQNEDAGQTLAAQGCAVQTVTLTAFDAAGDEYAVPDSCIVATTLIVEDVPVATLCGLNGSATPPDDQQYFCTGPFTLAVWESGEERGVAVASTGAGCTDTITLEWEIVCAGRD